MLIFYHECGNPFWVESKPCGDGYLSKYFDGREEGHGEKLTHCPTCQQFLGEPPKQKGNYESVSWLR